MADPEEKAQYTTIPNRLVVELEEDQSKDNSVVEINSETMEELDIFDGDVVQIKGKMQQSIICFAVQCDEVEPHKIAMNKVTRKNLKVGGSDLVTVKRIDQVNARFVKLAPVEETVEGVRGDFQQVFLRPYFRSYPGRPVQKNDLIMCPGAMQEAWFKVLEVQGADGESEWGCVITDGDETTVTRMEVAPAISQDEAEAELNAVGYADIGGLKQQLTTIREVVELPIRHPKLFSTIGVRAPKGVLMHGPPGTGKTLIARAISNETGCYFHTINGPEIMSGKPGGSEKNLRDAFAEAAKQAPAIVFIDEIDAIAPNRDKVQDENMRRVVATLLTLMDGLSSSGYVMVIGATNRPDALDPALRRAGRFDTELVIGVPSQAGRREILDIMTRKQKLGEDVDLDKLAEITHGYVGADISALCMKAAISCIRRHAASIDLEAEELEAEFLDSLRVVQSDFMKAVGEVPPSALKDVVVSVPNVGFDDIGGLEGVKRELREMVEFPVKYASYFEEQGIQPPKGALFYGPPGCGKTLLAKAMANECSANFISVKGPQLLTKWVGESESNVRGIFDKARNASPCILFFDELDSLAPARSSGGGLGGRVVNQLLTEMDGVGERGNLFVLGATNRPDTIDQAILRPGRLDQLVYIPLPDVTARAAILRAQLRNSNVADDVNLELLAQDCDKYSGADLAGLCQTAVKLSVRQRIQTLTRAARAAEAEKEAAAAGGEVKAGEGGGAAAAAAALAELPSAEDWTISHACFEIAKSLSGRSVSDQELLMYSAHAHNLQEELGAKSQLNTEQDAQALQGTYRRETAEAGGGGDAGGDDGDDDDIYA